MNKLVHRLGFTLIEMVVVVGVFGMVMAAVTGILIDTFKANNRTKLNDMVMRNGNWSLGELRRNILSSSGNQIICSVGVGNSISVVNLNDGQETKIICYENQKIASESALGVVDLTSSSEVKVSGCDNFAVCNENPSSTMTSSVDFKFKLSAGVAGNTVENYAEKEFNSKVTVRN